MLGQVQAIIDFCSQTTAHRVSCVTLGQRCENFLFVHESLSPSSIDLLDDLLKEILPFVKKFILPTILNSSLNAENVVSWFEGVLDDLISDLKSFQLYNQRIDQLGVVLGVSSTAIDPCHNVFDHCETITKDLEAFFQAISAFQGGQGGDKIRLLNLRARCLSLEAQWSETNNKIFLYQNQIGELINQKQNPTASDEIRPQLTQILHSIEDFISTNTLNPQHLILIEALNDSLVNSMGEFHQSLLNTFSTEFGGLIEAIQRLHQNQEEQNRLLLENQDRILSTLSRLEFTRREESVRQERLHHLKKFPSHFTIDRDSVLGRGGFAEVKSGRMDDHPVAIKIIQVRENSFSSSMKSAIENEVLLMSLCSHPCVLKVFGYCEVDLRTTHLILELGTMGSLWSILDNKTRFPSIPLSLLIAWIADILSALCYLHELRIIHRDVKAENVLVCDGLICKVSDFGVSKQLMESSFGVKSTKHAGTLSFMAPENFPPHGRYSHRSDVYSFGVTCFQILMRSSPLSQHSEMVSHLMVSIASQSWKRFVEGSLVPDVSQRLCSRECLELIRDVQLSELIGGNPRASRTHPNFGEVQVLQSILTFGCSEASQQNRTQSEAVRWVCRSSQFVFFSLFFLSLHFSL
jgi:hypothetical protein